MPIRPKTIGTDPEKKPLASEAHRRQLEQPELSGLDLLRAAQTVLPETRRRELASADQPPWFEEGFDTEARLHGHGIVTTKLVHPDGDPYLPTLTSNVQD